MRDMASVYSLIVDLRSWASGNDGPHCSIMDDAADVLAELAEDIETNERHRLDEPHGAEK